MLIRLFLTFFLLNIYWTMNGQLPSIADQEINLGKTTIAYKEKGKGITLLCLHAVGHSSKDFESLYKHLPEQKYRIIALDFPAHGKSGTAKEPISAAYFQKIVEAFIRIKKLENIIIIGNSIGGAAAIRVASAKTAIKALVLSNPGGLDKGGFLATWFLNQKIKFFQKGKEKKATFQKRFERYYSSVLSNPKAMDRRLEITNTAYELAPILVEAWTSFKQKEEDLRSLIKDVNCPVLFAWAQKDKAVQFSRNKAAIQQFKNHQVILYKDAGHTPYLECPMSFIYDLEQFINESLNTLH